MLTSKQHALLSFISDTIDDTGCAPSFDDMRERMGLASKSGVHRLVSALEERGFITRRPHLARSIEVLRDVPGRGRKPGLQLAAAPSPSGRVRLPLYGSVAAGLPAEALAEATEHVEVPVRMVGPGDHYALRVTGDSMTGDGILDGDVAIVRRSSDFVEGRILVVLVAGADAALKRLKIRGDVAILLSSNPEHPPRMAPARSAEVQGELVGILRFY